MNDSDFVKLLIWRDDNEPDRFLIALRATADYYGWTKEFEPWTPKPVGVQNGIVFVQDPGRRGLMQAQGGVRLRVSRAKSKSGIPAGQVNAFRVSSSCTLFDIAEIAHFTDGDWYWMTSPSGTRITRDKWERRYQAGDRSHR